MADPVQILEEGTFHMGRSLSAFKQNETTQCGDSTTVQTNSGHTSTASSSRSSSRSTISTTSGFEYLEDCEVAYLDSQRLLVGGHVQRDILAVTEPEIHDDDVDSIQLPTGSTCEVGSSGALQMVQIGKVKDDNTLQPQKAPMVDYTVGNAVQDVLANLNHGRNVIEPTPEMRRKVRLATVGIVEDDNPATDAVPLASSNGSHEPTGDDTDHLWRNEFFIIKKSPLGGYGAFAARDLKYGEIILVEKPLVRTAHIGLYNAVDALDLEEKLLYIKLAKFPPVDNCGIPLVERVRQANAFHVPGGVAIFSVASRFNHACEGIRNVLYSFEKIGGRHGEEVIVLQIINPEGVAKDQELTVKYGNIPAILMQHFGFRCQCGGCPEPLSDREANQIRQKWGWARQWEW